MGAEQIKSTEQNTETNESLGEMLRAAMRGFEEQNKKAYDLLVSLADEGFLCQHQTSGALDSIANRLLGTLEGGEGKDAD